jgi:hypothetical protein
MPAIQETIERVRRIDVDQYKYGFVTDIESDRAPKGLSEDTVRFISVKKNEPEWMLAWRLDAYRRWVTMPALGAGRIRSDRLPGFLLLRGAEEEAGADIARRDRSADPQDLREARYPFARTGDSCWCRA